MTPIAIRVQPIAGMTVSQSSRPTISSRMPIPTTSYLLSSDVQRIDGIKRYDRVEALGIAVGVEAPDDASERRNCERPRVEGYPLRPVEIHGDACDRGRGRLLEAECESHGVADLGRAVGTAGFA